MYREEQVTCFRGEYEVQRSSNSKDLELGDGRTFSRALFNRFGSVNGVSTLRLPFIVPAGQMWLERGYAVSTRTYMRRLRGKRRGIQEVNGDEVSTSCRASIMRKEATIHTSSRSSSIATVTSIAYRMINKNPAQHPEHHFHPFFTPL